MTFNDLCNRVAGELPPGYQVTIELELDSGSVELFDPDGNSLEFPTNYEGIEQQVLDALEFSKDHVQ